MASKSCGSWKPCESSVMRPGILRRVSCERTPLLFAHPADIQARASDQSDRQRLFGWQQPTPDRIGQQTNTGDLRDRKGDTRGGLVVAMRVVCPTREKVGYAMIADRRHYGLHRKVEIRPVPWRERVRQVQKADLTSRALPGFARPTGARRHVAPSIAPVDRRSSRHENPHRRSRPQSAAAVRVCRPQ